VKVIPCPRCQSMNTKFCYYNNYSVNQPRHFCRNCQRYWTVGGTLRNVPVGGGSRKKTRPRGRGDAYLVRGGVVDADVVASMAPNLALLSASSCMSQLSMLPPALGFASQLPFLGGYAGSSSLMRSPISGLQEVPELQSFYDPVPQLAPVNSAPSHGFLLPELQSVGAHNDALASVMVKAGLWPAAAPQMQAPTAGRAPSPWGERPLDAKPNSLPLAPIGPTLLNSKLAPLHAGFWENTPLMPSRPLMDDRLVPHVTSNSFDERVNSTNVSPNSSTTDERCPPSNSFGFHEVSQPWVGLQASDILQF
jgi:hypothetical protein